MDADLTLSMLTGYSYSMRLNSLADRIGSNETARTLSFCTNNKKLEGPSRPACKPVYTYYSWSAWECMNRGYCSLGLELSGMYTTIQWSRAPVPWSCTCSAPKTEGMCSVSVFGLWVTLWCSRHITVTDDCTVPNEIK